MLNFELMGLRLRHYTLAWLLGFVLVLAGGLIAGLLLHMDLIAAINLLLMAAFVLIAVLAASFLALTAAARESAPTKAALILMGLFLLVPLLWAPVLGAIVSAFFGHVSIEYSGVYAAFRIAFGKAIYGVMRLFSQNPVVDAGMKMMEFLAACVGFIASMTQLWEVLGKRRRKAMEG